ncbi:basic membrane protein A [Clostridium tetanomorphum]|uniref:BMP family ABC transporter substrate-binding protein n=1 Tax=Clostridium tetanomorphum TaxID=1553 RepID=A0A923EE75_CLOTT|nr:BMP family ABC transporter substrate-binding protein [Clostridium tetanomorphum]KAJ48964.1 Bmp family membrane protein [Clostridium tetanomorphum DSM 665]KAJ51323.1 Bmp family membrane protein [Clostridium tetanomorphum DSM 665]MBC2399824.1 BMP family ABC transporter substrate-binding protein [Clostridium tetanomorphum]MBP1865988.1 basic membrane protein A [Clostridium tetanomorphum]NRS85958.1 basic membrane protein A [Clostridium tetanomorphum]
MKKTKLFSIVLIFTFLISALFVGCGDKKDASQKKAGDKSEIKVGFLYVGPIGDGGWSYSHDQGRLHLEKELKVSTIYKESVKEDTAEVQKVTEDMINQGCNVIVGTSFGFMDGLEKEAKKHPEVKFLHCSGYKTAENMSNYFGRIYQARYLSGIVAGMKTKANEIGYVAAFPIPEVIRGINAFTLGVQSVNPKSKVIVKWTNTWYDPAKEKEAGKALLSEGVDVITQHQDTAGPQQAAEEKGAFSIGYNTDMKDKAPKAYMTAPVWNWGPYYVNQIKAIQNGTWKSESYWKGLEDGIVALADLTKNAPAGAKEAVEKAKQDIISGKNKIFEGPIKDQKGNVKVEAGKVMSDEELLKFDWFVQGVEGQIQNK